jgi:fructokinase
VSDRIGIDLGGTKIAGVRIGVDGTIVAEARLPTPRGDYGATLDAIAALVARLEGDQRLAVGVGTPGSTAPGTNVMQNCNSVWLNGRSLQDDLAGRLGREVRLANDADCFTLSEAVHGAGSGHASVFGVILGTGVGGGFAIEGRLLAGPNALTGEWGHTPMPAPGVRDDPAIVALESRLGPRPCYCGANGCIETWLSGPGLEQTHVELGGGKVPAHAIARGTADATVQALALYEAMLGRALAVVVNVVDPHAIVLGGGLSNLARLYAVLPALVERHVFAGRFRTPILAPRFGDASGVRGAAALWPAPQ